MNEDDETMNDGQDVDLNAAQQPITDSQNIPLQDGGIPQDSSAITDGQVDALGMENINVQFESGNYQQIQALPQIVTTKVQSVTKTLIPLIEVALIELTGSSQSYKRKFAQITPSIDQNSNLALELNIQYEVAGYIGTDFEYADLQSDSSYIYNRITPAGIKITKCEIDTSNGIITIMGAA